MSSLISKHSIGIMVNLDNEKQFNILHVDDDKLFLEVAEEILALKGFNVDTVASVKEALQKLKEKEYDAVVSDYQMPGKDGLRFLKELRETGNTIPFIMLTGKGMETEAIQALNNGADYYVNKNLNNELMFEELAHDIAKAVETRKTQLQALLGLETIKAIFESAPNAIMIVDPKGIIIASNHETVRFWGFSKTDEMIGQNILEFIEKEDRENFREYLKKALKQGTAKKISVSLLTEYSDRRYGQISASILKDKYNDPSGLVVVVTDITEHEIAESKLKKYSERLEEHRRFLENVFSALPDTVSVCDLKGNIIKCNHDTDTDLLHADSPAKRLLGLNLYDLVLEKDRETVVAELKKAQDSSSTRTLECTLMKGKQDEFPAELSLAVIKDYSEEPLGFVCVVKNLSERKRLQEQLLISEKIGAVGKLAASFSHDIRNPLAVIKNSVSFLEMRLNGNTDEKITKHLHMLKQEINRTDSMVNDLLDFARKKQPNLQEANLNHLIESTLSSISISENIKLSLDFGKIPDIPVDVGQLQRVLVNIILNAIQAMPEGGELKVETRRNQNLVEIAISDSGIGIPEKAMHQIFTPFFSTKSNGVGLGLNLSKQIVEAHQGKISLLSEEGRGSTFIIKLPIPTNDKHIAVGNNESIGLQQELIMQ